MSSRGTADQIDAKILRALQEVPDATIVAIAQTTGLSRNTVRARLAQYGQIGALEPFDWRVNPAFLGFPLRAFIFTSVRQRMLDEVAGALADIPEVLSIDGLSGATDLLVQVVARDAEGLYRIAADILAIEGVERTETGLVMRSLVARRVLQLADAQPR